MAMQEKDFSTSLAVLRVIRGWSQEELARHSGVRPSSISDYERGKIVPGAGTLLRLLDAMGYPFSALDDTQTLIATLRAESELRSAARLARPGSPEAPATARREGETGAPGSTSPSRHWEVEQASVEAGKVAARLTRLFFSLVEPRLAAPEAREPEPGSPE
jgi:transcriptional regulator with XRE-family HTH domain